MCYTLHVSVEDVLERVEHINGGVALIEERYTKDFKLWNNWSDVDAQLKKGQAVWHSSSPFSLMMARPPTGFARAH